MSLVKVDAVVLKEVAAETVDVVATVVTVVGGDEETYMAAEVDAAVTEEVAVTDPSKTTHLHDEAAPLPPP